ncbi:MAG: cytochrome c3 family protein [Gammaproteobacteria bacterium]|nr:cytochrome c3 family protein [Gammaproteobacteria bacterium]
MSRGTGLVALILMVAVVGTLGGGWALDHRIHGEGFCHSCHLPDGGPLHGPKMATTVAEPPQSLAGLHYHQPEEERLRCPDCHHGADWRERLIIMSHAARNTFQYFFGDFREPDEMRVPIPDHFCNRCHADVAKKAPFQSFHSSWGHGEMQVMDRVIGCTECHVVHDQKPAAGTSFMAREPTLEICRACHGRSLIWETVEIQLKRDLGLRP